MDKKIQLKECEGNGLTDDLNAFFDHMVILKRTRLEIDRTLIR